jgi:exodeoxyribonuclease VII large subunit
MFEPASVFSVSDITFYIKSLLERDRQLRQMTVAGELSNLKMAASGHWYFTLKDGQAQLPCVMFRQDVSRLGNQQFSQGDKLEATGSISVYAPGGRYQLQVRHLRRSGLGQLYQAFLERKERLAREGLFDEDRKRPLPAFPGTVAVVSSAQGAAIHDLLSTLEQRFPHLTVLLVPALVQGETAGTDLVESLRAAASLSEVSLVVLARGGGSFEDLFCFNDENLVRAIAACSKPVVTGVGHETDFTLADFAADARAATPTAVAARIVPEANALREELEQARRRQFDSLLRQVGQAGQRLDDRRERLVYAVQSLLQTQQAQLHHQRDLLRRHSLRERLERRRTQLRERLELRHRRAREELNSLRRRMYTAMRERLDQEGSLQQALLHNRLQQARHTLHLYANSLECLDVQRVLERGFSLTHDEEGKLLRSIEQVPIGGRLYTRLQDGALYSTITQKASPNLRDERSSNAPNQ